MKIAVMGAGGVGGCFGARLAQSGEDVWFIARGAHLAALRSGGLRVVGDAGNVTLPTVNATDDPAQVGPVELVLLTTKAYDLEGAARQIAPMVGPQTSVLPLLNGADIAERLGTGIDAARVLGGLCMVSARIEAPGLIRQVGPLLKIVLGEFSGEATPRANAIAGVLRKAGIPVDVAADIRAEIWKKFLFIGAASGVCAVTQTLLGPVLDDPDTRALYVGCMEECAAVAAKLGIALPPTIVADTLAFSAKLPKDTKPSMLFSVEQGAKLEVEVLNGTVARLGRECGVPTPVHAFIYAALKQRAAGRAA